MKISPKQLEEMADALLEEDAKANGTTLFKEGILDKRRQGVIRKREIPLSKWMHKNGDK